MPDQPAPNWSLLTPLTVQVDPFARDALYATRTPDTGGMNDLPLRSLDAGATRVEIDLLGKRDFRRGPGVRLAVLRGLAARFLGLGQRDETRTARPVLAAGAGGRHRVGAHLPRARPHRS